MLKGLLAIAVALSCVLLGSCGGASMGTNGGVSTGTNGGVSTGTNGGVSTGTNGGLSTGTNVCNITAVVTPVSATADHSLLPPGNQVQFSAISTVTGNCPLAPDQIGLWSTSDTVNTSIGNEPPTRGLATCINATPSAVTITYSGTVRGHAFAPATLTCK